MRKITTIALLGLAALTAGPAAAAAVDQLQAEYRAAGAGAFSAERGARLFRQGFPHPDGERACTTCHGSDPAAPGKHARTGKVIKPMAPSVEPSRLSDVRKVRKWLLRNCKWTLGRECTPQEKGDLLAWLGSR